MKTRKIAVVIVAIAAIAALLCVSTGDAFARAGGGHSSSHSSSSSSSSKSWGGSSSSKSYGGSSGAYGGSYGGSSGCGLLGLGLGAIFGGTGFIIFIIIAIVVWALKKASGTTNEQPSSSYEPEPSSAEEREDTEIAGLSSIENIKAKDTNFSERVFLDKAQTIFFELQKAWMNRDLAPVRPYVSDGVFNRWQIFIDQYKRDKQINVIKDPVINNARIVRVQEEGDLDSITVRLDCSMADAMVSEANPNQVVSGSLTEHKPFTEYWAFVRKATIQTKADAKATIDKCPNCGAPLKISAAGNCEYCDTLVHSPEYDWILDQITQAEEWA